MSVFERDYVAFQPTLFWQCIESRCGKRCKGRLVTTNAPDLIVVKSSGHSLVCCFQRSSDDPHSAETPSRNRKKSSPEHQPAKRTRLTDNSTSVVLHTSTGMVEQA